MSKRMYNCISGVSLLAYFWASCVLPILHVHAHQHVASSQQTAESSHTGHQHTGHEHQSHHHHDREQQTPLAPEPVPCDHHDSNCLICQHAAAKILASTAFSCDSTIEFVHNVTVEAITVPDTPSLYTPLQRGPPLFA